MQIDPIAGFLEEVDDLVPAGRVVPVFALGGALRRDADVGFGDRPACRRRSDARRHLGRIDAQDIAGGAMQPDVAKVAGLMQKSLSSKNRPML